MNDDYLWDKSGPGDPEIEHLEKTLGRLRYTPNRIVPLPPTQRWVFRHPFFPVAAAAAAVVIFLLAGATRFYLNRPGLTEVNNSRAPLAPAANPASAGAAPSEDLPERERVVGEAENAKAQLILALHIASEKLTAAQKKIKATPET